MKRALTICIPCHIPTTGQTLLHLHRSGVVESWHVFYMVPVTVPTSLWAQWCSVLSFQPQTSALILFGSLPGLAQGLAFKVFGEWIHGNFCPSCFNLRAPIFQFWKMLIHHFRYLYLSSVIAPSEMPIRNNLNLLFYLPRFGRRFPSLCVFVLHAR